MSTLRPLGFRGKAALVAEILYEYVPSWRILRASNVNTMVRLARAVDPASARGPAGPEHETARRLGRAVLLTLRLLPVDSRCLIRSLVLTRLLARRSIPNTLVIGVRKAPEFEAHAWVEHEGRPILPAGEFTRLIEL